MKLYLEYVEREKHVSGRREYILGIRRQDFYKVGIREPRMPTYHRMLLVELIGEEDRRHRMY